MAVTKNAGRQYLLSAEVVVTFEDFTEAVATATPGETQEAIDLPSNYIITGGFLSTVTDYVAAAEAITMDVGEVSPLDIDEYLNGVSVDGDEGTVDQLLILGFVRTAASAVSITAIAATGSDAYSAGASHLVVEYVTTSRSNDQIG
jgi:hypothetical protein